MIVSPLAGLDYVVLVLSPYLTVGAINYRRFAAVIVVASIIVVVLNL